MDDSAVFCPTCGGKGRKSLSVWYIWNPILLLPIFLILIWFLVLVGASLFSTPISTEDIAPFFLICLVVGIVSGISQVKERNNDALAHEIHLNTSPFTVGDRVRVREDAIGTAKPEDTGYEEEVILLDAGREGTVTGFPHYNKHIPTVRWDAGIYRIYRDTVRNISGKYINIDKGTVHLDSFETTVYDDTLEKSPLASQAIKG